jgi:hypothetical protein
LTGLSGIFRGVIPQMHNPRSGMVDPAARVVEQFMGLLPNHTPAIHPFIRIKQIHPNRTQAQASQYGRSDFH